MMKHIGMHRTLGVRYVVLFRETPGEPDTCLVVESDSLNPMIHDNLMAAVESPECQGANHLGEALDSRLTTSGENLFRHLHNNGLIRKVKIDEVVLTPTPGTRVGLREINNIINGKDPSEGTPTPAANDAAPVATAPAPVSAPVTTDDPVALAKQLLAQAVRLNPELAGKTITETGEIKVKGKPGRPKKSLAA